MPTETIEQRRARLRTITPWWESANQDAKQRPRHAVTRTRHSGPVATYGPCAELLRRLCPADLEGQSIYVLVDHRGEILHPQAAAATHTWFDEMLRPTLEQAGHWRGPGFACVIRPMDELRTLSAVTHELAHYLADNSVLRERFTGPEMLELARRYGQTEDAESERRHHGPRFARAVSHLAWRVQRHVHSDIHPSHLWTPSQYGYTCSADDVVMSLAFELGCDSIRDQLDVDAGRDFAQVTARVTGR